MSSEKISPTLRKRKAWAEVAGVMAIFGGLAIVIAVYWKLIVVGVTGLATVALATIALLFHRRLGTGPLRTRAARKSKLRAELISCMAGLALSLSVISLLFAPYHRPLKSGFPVSGKPVEVRSWERLVIMPDGQSYRFWCGGRRGGTSYCPAQKKWQSLPRWPEPEHIEMEVGKGSEIISLIMDGHVIVDPKVDNTGKMPWLIAAALLLALALVWATLQRIRGLRALEPSAKGRDLTKSSVNPAKDSAPASPKR